MWLAFRSIALSELLQKIESANYWYIALSLAIGFLGIYFRAWRWAIMIEPLGYNVKVSKSFYALCIGYMANYALPRVGEVTRCGVLGRTANIPADKLLGTVIAERLFDIVVLFFLTALVILLKFKLFGTFFYDKVFQPIVEKLTGIMELSLLFVLIIIGLVILFGTLGYIFRERILNITLVRKIGEIGKGVKFGLFSVVKMERLGAFLLQTLFMWSTYWLMTYTFLLSMEPTAHLDIVDALFIMVSGSYGMAAPVQAGIGAFHGIVALALSIYTISWADGLAFAVLSHGAQAIGIIVVGILAILILFNKKFGWLTNIIKIRKK